VLIQILFPNSFVDNMAYLTLDRLAKGWAARGSNPGGSEI